MPRTSMLQTTAASTAVDGELDVTQVEDSHEELACLGNMLLRKPDGFECQLELFEVSGIVVLNAMIGGVPVPAH